MKFFKNHKTFSIFILFFIVLAIYLSVWQRGNIKAVFDFLNYSDDEISEMITKNKEDLEKEIKTRLPEMVSDFTEDEEKKIMSGELSVEEVMKNKLEELEKNKVSTSENKDTKKLEIDNIISSKVIEFYSLKAYYLGQLGQMEKNVIKDYTNLPKNKQNLIGKKELVSKYMSTATSLMNQCDEKVNSLLKELETDIKAKGGDLEIISIIRTAYENEKNLKKSYYMSKLK